MTSAAAMPEDALERIDVPLEIAGGMWAAAVYLAVLAFPESTRKRTAFLEDVKALFVQEAARSWSKRPRFAPQARYLKRPRRALEQSGPLVTATRRFERERLPAAAIALDLLIAKASRGAWFRIEAHRAGVAARSLNSATRGLARQFREKGWRHATPSMEQELKFAENFRKRGWRASQPVLHLGMALRSAIDAGAPASVPELVRAPGWVARAIAQAEQLRPLVRTLRQCKASGTIAIRPSRQNLNLSEVEHTP
jgi:hypothetical protein